MTLCVRLILAAMFTYSSLSKARSPRRNSEELRFMFGIASAGVIWMTLGVEVLLAVSVLAWPGHSITSAGGLVVILSLTLFYGIRLVATGDTACACFGVRPSYFEGDERSLVVRVGTVTGHALGNGTLVLLWLVATRDAGLFTRADTIFAVALGPVFIVALALVAAILKAKAMTRLPLHPTARSMTVDTVRLGRCKRLSTGRAGVKPKSGVHAGVRSKEDVGVPTLLLGLPEPRSGLGVI